MFIVHGTADVPIKIDEVEKLYSIFDKNLTSFVKLENVGRMYGAKHPYKGESPVFNHVLDIITHWLHLNLQTEASWK